MNDRGRPFFLVLCCVSLLAGRHGEWDACAQAPGDGGAARDKAVTPPIPTPSSPVDPFRRLLAADATERERLLALRPEAQREKFRAALRDYDRLTPGERDLRLQALDLRFQITYLLRLPPAGRTQAFAKIPAAYQPLVRSRLSYWNSLAPDVQQKMLLNERLMKVFTYIPVAQSPPPMPTLGSNQLGRLNAAITSLNFLSKSKRAAAEEAFKQMLKNGAVSGVEWTAEQREDMQRVLQHFNNLSPARQDSCLRNYQQFAALSVEERRTFLRSAEEWQRMSAADRNAWKELVEKSSELRRLPRGFYEPLTPVASRMPERESGTNANVP